MSFLDKIKGPAVEAFGLGFAAVTAFFLLKGGHRVGVLASLAVYLVAWFLPQLFSFLQGFAEIPAWPKYVARGVATLFAAHAGGLPAILVIGGLLTNGDGAIFDLLY